jgi:hypothetical protein
MKKQIFKISANASINSYAVKTVNNEEFYLVPVVALQEQVVNGFLALSEEFGKYPDSWNGVPLPIGHPQDIKGNYISAKSPDLINQSAGFFFDAKIEDNKLKGNLYLKKEFIDSDDEMAVLIKEKLENGYLEVSTGYFSEIEKEPGVFNNVEYVAIQRNVVPDHLALLPEAVGACSVSDGCGAPRTNQNRKEEEFVKDLKQAWDFRESPTTNELSFDQIQMALYEAIANRENVETYEIWLAEVYDSLVIYECKDKIYKNSYVIDSDNVAVLASDKQEVERMISYVPVTTNQGGDPMKQKVDLLINCDKTKFTEKDRDWLMSLNEDQLDKLGVVEPVEDSNPTEKTPSANQKSDSPASPNSQENAPLTADQVASIVKENSLNEDKVAEIVANVLVKKEQDKEVATLVANILQTGSSALSEDTLKTLPVDVLRKIAEDTGANGFFIGGPMTANFGMDENDIPAPPAIAKARPAASQN